MNLGQIIGNDAAVQRKIRKMEILSEKQKKKRRDAERSRAINSGSIFVYRKEDR